MTECHKELSSLIDSPVSIITNDGRNIIGTLKGLDQKLNVILEECYERVFFKRSRRRAGDTRFVYCSRRQHCNSGGGGRAQG
mmetsp:Transcript_16288/g.54566  ORF Transcript_16288/g.54566 Transcript_16288/m.54566 type:complete len:82 (-) Transcript_16288:142-387(-)